MVMRLTWAVPDHQSPIIVEGIGLALFRGFTEHTVTLLVGGGHLLTVDAERAWRYLDFGMRLDV